MGVDIGILLNNGTVRLIDYEGGSLSKPKIFEPNIYVFQVGLVAVFVSASDMHVAALFQQYWHVTPRVPLDAVAGISVRLVKHPAQAVPYYEEGNGICKGITEDGTKWFSMGTTVAEVSPHRQTITVFYTDDDPADFVPFINKVIEGTLIDGYVAMGYLPVHSSACLRDGGDSVLMLGESQTGKTSTALFLEKHGLRVVADEVTFIDGHLDMIGLGHFRRRYNDIPGGGAQREFIGGVLRFYDTILNDGTPHPISTVILLNRHEGPTQWAVMENTSIKLLLDYIRTRPLSYFSDETALLRASMIAHQLRNSKDTRLVQLSYSRNNDEPLGLDVLINGGDA